MLHLSSCGLLIVAMAMSGCEQQKSLDTVGGDTAVTASDSTELQLAQRDVELFVEDVASGNRIDPFANPETKVFVLIFISTDCPIANQYAPELGRLFEIYQAKNVSFWLVYADPEETQQKIRKHIEEYQYQIPALRDPDHQLVKLCKVTRTPEAVVFAAGREQRYRGRIDDRFTDYGKSRKLASQHDLQEAIKLVLAARSVPSPVTKAIGCYIPGVAE